MPKNNKGELLLKLLGIIEPGGQGFWEGGSEGRVTHVGPCPWKGGGQLEK